MCLYLLRSADFLVDPEDLYSIFSTCFSIYKAQRAFTDALRVALKMDDRDKITELFAHIDALAAAGALTEAVALTNKRQMAFILAHHRSNYSVEGDDELNAIIGNATLSERFLAVARSMDVLDPKLPDDIYKTSDALSGARRGLAGGGAAVVESARANLASSFVNAFVNAGMCSDKLMLGSEAGSSWVSRNKDHAMLSATASLGAIMMWNLGATKKKSMARHPSPNSTNTDPV